MSYKTSSSLLGPSRVPDPLTSRKFLLDYTPMKHRSVTTLLIEVKGRLFDSRYGDKCVKTLVS